MEYLDRALRPPLELLKAQPLGEADDELRRSVARCDEVLQRMQQHLHSFRTDLQAVTNDIDSLQKRSDNMAARLKNRVAIEAVLGPAIDESILSPELVQNICEAPIDRTWVTHLQRLDAYGSESGTRLIASPVKELERLRIVAIARIRDYIVSKIKQLRLPAANVGVIQQSLLRLRKIYAFLHRHHEGLAKEIAQAYSYTMRWYYQSSFDRYQKALSKIPVRQFAKTDLLGADDRFKAQADLALGTRARHLHDKTSGIILAHVAETEKKPRYVERVFRSYILALVDNAAVEYLFQNEFFKPKGSRQVAELFSGTLEPALKDAQTWTRTASSESIDVVGLLICIRQCQRLLYDLQKRKVAALEGFLDGLLITLWPRLQAVMDMHATSLRHASLSVTAINESVRQKRPLVLTTRFADLVAGILQLCRDTQAEAEPVASSLDRLVHDYQSTLTRMAAACDAAHRNAFLHRNHLHVWTTLENTAGGSLGDRHKVAFEQFAQSLAPA